MGIVTTQEATRRHEEGPRPVELPDIACTIGGIAVSDQAPDILADIHRIAALRARNPDM